MIGRNQEISMGILIYACVWMDNNSVYIFVLWLDDDVNYFCTLLGLLFTLPYVKME